MIGHSELPLDPDAEFTGKYERSGRIGNWLIDRFFNAARSLLSPHLRPGQRVLEIGCGAGYSTERIIRWHSGVHWMASEIGPSLAVQARRRNQAVPVLQQSVYALAHADKSVDALIMLEVLEHLDQPEQALNELQRVARDFVLLSTPREPIWRMLNMARGKYLRNLGNTPGHIQHWSTRGLVRRVSPWFKIAGIATPLPWTILLLKPRR